MGVLWATAGWTVLGLFGFGVTWGLSELAGSSGPGVSVWENCDAGPFAWRC